jgi:hypothetical protein
MINDELIENIKGRFLQGEKAEEIREALLNEGWSAGDIDAAFAHIRHDALMQIPLYAKFHHWMESVDQKTAQLPTRTMVQIFIGIGLIFIGGVVALYFFLDPLGIQTSQRDKQREDYAIALRESLDNYYKDKHLYPTNITQLVPKYLSAVPLDPKTHKPYSYKPLENNVHYEFCIEFEMQPIRCASSDSSSEIPNADQSSAAMQPTATPMPLSQITQYGINGQVYIDTNKNKTKDDIESVQESVVVKVTDSSNKLVCDITTDTAGIFDCTLPGKGQYTVRMVLPPGYISPLGNPVTVTLPDTTSPQPNVTTLFVGLVK